MPPPLYHSCLLSEQKHTDAIRLLATTKASATVVPYDALPTILTIIFNATRQ